jgi:YbbR domain-containing protein
MIRLRLQGAQLLLGLLLSLTLWTYVSFSTNPNSVRTFPLPVQVANRPDDLLIVNSQSGLPEDFSAEAQVTLSGPKQDLDRLRPQDLATAIDLADLGPGPHEVKVEVTKKPTWARTGPIDPATFVVSLARAATSTVPIRPTKQGQPPVAFSAGEITVGARESVVRGPEDQVRDVVAAEAQVDLQGQTREISRTVTLKPVDSSGTVVEGVRLSPDSVSVQVPITTQVAVQSVSIVPDLEGQPAPGYAIGSINWDPKIIEVLSTNPITGPIQTEEIDIGGLTTSITRTVGLERLPNVITRPTQVPVTVRVSIVPITVDSQLPLLVPVSYEGPDPGLTPQVEPAAVRVTLAGPFDRLSQLTSTEVTATVDLRGLGPGSYTLPVRIATPPGLSTVNASEPQVQVTIRPVPTPSPEPTAPPPTETAAPAGYSGPGGAIIMSLAHNERVMRRGGYAYGDDSGNDKPPSRAFGARPERLVRQY